MSEIVAEKPRWEVLQREWNRLVPYAQAAGIPRVREIKIGAEAIAYREKRLNDLKSQLRGALGREGFDEIAALQPADPAIASLIKPQPAGAADVLRHDMRLQLYDVTVRFADGSEVVLKVQARDPLTAVRTASYAPAREWPPEKLLSIILITPKKVS